MITPATAGPFDLGTVVVRVALFVDPRTAQVHAVSDPIPHVYGGALLDIRSVSVKLDRDEFSLNPTNCSHARASAATLLGGGANPVDPAAFSSLAGLGARSRPAAATSSASSRSCSCASSAATRRAKNPKLRAVLVARARRRQHRPRRRRSCRAR